MSVYDLLLDYSIASVLILLGQLLRSKVKIFQQFFIPASMLAGFMGLVLGAQGLGIISFSSVASSYSGVLIIMIFAIVGINGFKLEGGHGAKAEAKRIVSFQIYRFLVLFMQFIIPIAVTLTVIKALAPDVNSGIGILLAAGFTGGHGTAAAVGNTFADLGWEAGTDLGMTFATVGILSGIFGGLAMIKWATHKGYTGYIKDFSYISGDLKTGLVSKENRHSVGEETISPVSLDTLCFHLSLVTAISGGGYALNKFVIAPYILSGIPDFTVAYILALIYFGIFGKTKLYDYVDTKINNKISGTCTDYLVFFGIATINVTVIIEYIVPLTVLVLSGFLCIFLCMIPLGYLLNKDSWFERSLFCYGYSTGVFAIGFVLLRIVDPENKSKTIEDTAVTFVLNFVEVAFWSFFPAMLISGQGWTIVGIVSALFIVGLVLAISGKMIYKIPLNERKAIGVDVLDD